jgi:endonuclease/exonuclease/phosphatase family metal-dependent hydrolase
VRALTWNLYHGRSPKPSGRSLLKEFSAALAGWEWDVALLQEVPPWWPPRLAEAAGAQERSVLTSRNSLLWLRRLISDWNPDILKSNGGGANAILVRGDVLEHRWAEVTKTPERRVAHGVRLADGWVVNVHSSTHRGEWALRDTLRALEWAPEPLLLFGGDVNLRHPPGLPGLVHVAGNHVDHLFTTGNRTPPTRDGAVLERGPLSDHPPVAVTI